MARLVALLIPFLGMSLAQAADLPEATGIDEDDAASVGMSQEGSKAGGPTYVSCRSAIAEWAQPYRPVDMEVIRLGPTRRGFDGSRGTSLYVRIVYEVKGGLETRKADVDCTIDRNNSVVVVPTPRS